jgi:hypothetical protein
MAEQFDMWLERELRRQLTAVTPSSPPPAQARYQTPIVNRRHGMLRILPATVAAKAVAAVAVLAIAGSVTATLVTGSPNPQDWGQQVQAAVEQCRDMLHSGQHGIGDCVSDLTSAHGNRGHQAPATHHP